MTPAYPNSSPVKTATIELLEQLILNAKYSDAEKVLKILMQGKVKDIIRNNIISKKMVLSQSNYETEGYKVINKFSVLLTVMFSDQRYAVSDEMFNFYVQNKYFITYIFTASRYKNTDHIVKKLGLLNKKEYSKVDIKRFLILFTTESTFDLPWAQLAKFMPVEVIQAYLGMYSAMSFMMTKNSLAQLNKLAVIAPDLPLLNFKEASYLKIISSAYFSISNLTGPNKNEFKKWAVKNYQKFMDGHLDVNVQELIHDNIVRKGNEESKHNKKTILVIHEHYYAGHAMYRCFHSLIAGLNDDFHVIGLADTAKVDELGKKDSAEFLTYDNMFDFETIIKDIVKLSPDIILYPSIGMSTYVPLLATQRLAPIQCMCLGHPSSSYLPEIDYVHYWDIPTISLDVIQGFMAEKIMPFKGNTQGMVCTPYNIKLDVQRNNDVIKIAVNGVSQKITFELIEICQKITAASAVEVEFQFFLGGRRQDVDYFAALSTLKRLLPNHHLHPYQSYDAYMSALSECSFAIPTIPFGGSNSNIDCLRLALPKLYIKDERDFSGLTDYQMWEALEIIDGYCNSTKELIERATSYTNGHSEHYHLYKNKLENYGLTLLEQPVEEEVDKSFSTILTDLLVKENSVEAI